MIRATNSTACGWIAILAVVVGCSSPPAKPSPCGRAHATFHLVVDSEDRELPRDTKIHVKYGAGEESFDACVPEASLKVVFCKIEGDIADGGLDVSGDADNDGGTVGPIRRIVCELWTDGAATVTINATGFLETVRTLEAGKGDECGLSLTEARITLKSHTQRSHR